jgi:ribosomal protein S18 acetylase RimI-like enzyme
MSASSTPRDIRALSDIDLPALLQLYAHLHRKDEPLPEPRVVESVWGELLSSPHFFCFGGHENGSLVSSCTLVIVPNLTRGCRPYALIENVVTHTDYRNRGWGHTILSHAMGAAWTRRCHKVMLMTGRKDDAIIRFYESAGFDRNDKQAYVARPSAA